LKAGINVYVRGKINPMHIVYADTTYILTNMAEELRPQNIADLIRILYQDNFEIIFENGIVHVYQPTKERQRGENNYQYVFSGGQLIANTITQLSGIND
jgi:hypothetical protein